MSDLPFKKVNLDSVRELAADQFSVEVVGADAFRDASLNDRVTVPLGLKDLVTGDDQMITHIKDGVIDEYELVVSPTSQTVNLRGRDPLALLLDTYVRKQYIFASFILGEDGAGPDGTVQAQVDAALNNVTEVFDGSNTVTTPDPIDYEVGQFTASHIAQDVAEQAGLTLVWSVRDYQMRSTFSAVGRAGEILSELIRPWTLVEPYRVEVVASGTTLTVRYRQTPPGYTTPEYTFAVADMRRGSIRVRKRRAKKFGFIDLTGGLPFSTPTSVGLPPGEGDTEQKESWDIVTDSTGNTIATYTRTTSSITWGVVIRQEIRVYKNDFGAAGGDLIGTTDTHNTYLDSALAGPLLEQTTTTTKKLSKTGSLVDDSYSERHAIYDANTGFLQQEVSTTKTWAKDKDGFPDPTKPPTWTMNTKKIIEVAPGTTEETTTDYVGTAPGGGTPSWTLQKQDRQIQGGKPPGGPGRKRLLGEGNRKPFHIQVTLSDDPLAVPVSFSNEHMSYEDLVFIKDLMVQANNFEWEHEVMFDGVSMPWIQKYILIQVTDLVDQSGVDIPLPATLVTEVRTVYDESKRDAEFTSNVRAFGWE